MKWKWKCSQSAILPMLKINVLADRFQMQVNLSTASLGVGEAYEWRGGMDWFLIVIFIYVLITIFILFSFFFFISSHSCLHWCDQWSDAAMIIIAAVWILNGERERERAPWLNISWTASALWRSHTSQLIAADRWRSNDDEDDMDAKDDKDWRSCAEIKFNMISAMINGHAK